LSVYLANKIRSGFYFTGQRDFHTITHTKGEK